MPADRILLTVTLGELAEVPGTPFSYWAPHQNEPFYFRPGLAWADVGSVLRFEM